MSLYFSIIFFRERNQPQGVGKWGSTNLINIYFLFLVCFAGEACCLWDTVLVH